ncbi:MAG: efflux RND transporter periplasmic adaptor subunit [Candidatus Sericytochromatia bacterium]|nr:efflux RND transporter periplasmic adaptor subunit [Candidatus Sericytochromatia bacterium]
MRRPITLLTSLLLLATSPVWAHGGEDHGDAGPAPVAAAAGNTLAVTKESQFLLGIRTELATEKQLPKQIRVNGRIIARPQGQAAVMSPVTGTILPQSAIPAFGDRVRQGQTLAVVAQAIGAAERLQMKTEQFRTTAERSKATADLQVAIGSAAVAKATWQRAQRLSEVVAKKEIPLAEQAYRAAEAQVKALRAQLAQLDQQGSALQAMSGNGGGSLNRFVLTAPISGLISARDAVAGAQVTPDRRLFEIVDTSTVWVEAQIFETDLAAVETVRTASVRTAAYPDRQFSGRLVSLGQVVDDTTRTVKAVFAVANPAGTLRLGQFATVSLATGMTAKQVVVPQRAIYAQSGKQWLFVHTTPETFERREVVIAETVGDQSIVSQGIKAAERVVTTGAYQLLNMRAGALPRP